MNEEQGVEELLHDGLDLSEGEPDLLAAEEPSKVMLTELKNKVDATLLAVVGGG